MDDEVQGRRNLVPDSPYRQVQTAHEHHGFQTGQYIPRAIGMGSGERAVMAGVHGLQHVQRFAAADFADDNPVRTHTEGVLHQIPDGDLPFSFNVRRPSFQCHHVGLLQTKFCRIFDGHDTFIVGNERRNDIQGGGFTGTGTAGNHDIQLRLHAGPQENGHLFRQGAEGNEIFHGQRGF